MAQRRKHIGALFGFILMAAGCGGIALGLSSVPRGYELLFSPHAHAFRFAQAPEPVRRGDVSERFELRDGDCGGTDCQNSRYRSEIREENPRARVNEDNWYGWSFRNQTIPNFSAQNSLRLVMGQWKLAGETPPAFRLIQVGLGEGNWGNCDITICRRSNDTRTDVVVQLSDMSQTLGWSDAQNDGYICKLFSMEDARANWVDLVINTNFGTDRNGYLRIWVNSELKCDYRGQIVVSPFDAREDRPNVRRGIAASFTTRWDQSQGNRPKPTLIAYYDEFRWGKARQDVDVTYRESIGERPRN